jgi:hypothetical protein
MRTQRWRGSLFDRIAAAAVVLSVAKDLAVDRPGSVRAGDPHGQQA